MSFKETKTAVVSARLYSSTKKKLEASGYTAADAIEWFVHEYFSSKTGKKLKIRKEILTQNLESLKNQNEEISKQIVEIEYELSQLDQDAEGNNTNADVNIEECLHLPAPIIEGISVVQNAYQRIKERDSLNNIDEFIDKNPEFMTVNWDKYAKKMRFDEFCDLVREHVEDNVYDKSKQLRANP